MRDFILQLASIATVILCWGSYGPVLHKGQAAMQHSRFGRCFVSALAYFAIAVICAEFVAARVSEKPVTTVSQGT